MRPASSVDVFDVPSGLGGSFTVSVVEDHGESCKVRIWYGRATSSGWEAWPEFDGYTFDCKRADLTKPRKMQLVKREPSWYDR